MKENGARKDNELYLRRRNGWDSGSRSAIFNFAQEYKRFLNKSKTERECVETIENMVKENALAWAEDKNIYFLNKGKNAALVVRGKKPIEKGANIIVSHIDAPSLHLKQIPLYEDSQSGLCLFRTHYYGGIKNYQWVNCPLALYGVVIRNDGTKINICIGESQNDPVFSIPDLLPHLSRKAQDNKKATEVIPSEKLCVLAGSLPLKGAPEGERIKSWVLDYLHQCYGLVEEDFISAEISLVPAGPARDLGLDRSLILGYGHDDRSCSYASLRAVLDIAQEKELPEKTIVAFFLDKEEIGSEGVTGAKSNFIEYVLSELLSSGSLIKTLRNSIAISADVNAGVNPNWPEPHEVSNAAKIGYGVCLTKFTGSGGKFGSSDASAEYVGLIRRILNETDVIWQAGALGKVDEGGGGTIAKFLAERGIEVIDLGLPVISMHAPLEIISKVDLFETYRAYKAFFKKA